MDLYQTSVWDATTGARLCTVPVSATYVAWSTDSRMFATVLLYGDDDGKSTDATQLQMWDATSGASLSILPPLHPYNFAFSPDGTLFAVSTDKGITLWGNSSSASPPTSPNSVTGSPVPTK
jgi:hypothetical protein